MKEYFTTYNHVKYFLPYFSLVIMLYMISTEHAVLNIVNPCYNNVEKKGSGSVFLDLAKAFDTVDYQILLHKLEHYGIRRIFLQFYQSFLENRK